MAEGSRTPYLRSHNPVLYLVSYGHHRQVQAVRGDQLTVASVSWSGQRDSNSRLPAPKAGALPGCAIPRKSVARCRPGTRFQARASYSAAPGKSTRFGAVYPDLPPRPASVVAAPERSFRRVLKHDARGRQPVANGIGAGEVPVPLGLAAFGDQCVDGVAVGSSSSLPYVTAAPLSRRAAFE